MIECGGQPVPKKAEELSALSVGRITEPGLHFVGGVAGLILQVLPSGGRSWVLRLTVASKRRDMGLGGFPDVTLAGAREAARAARSKADARIDTIDERDWARAMLRLAKANACDLQRRRHSIHRSPGRRLEECNRSQQWRNSLANYAYPIIGHKMVSDIELPQMLDVTLRCCKSTAH